MDPKRNIVFLSFELSGYFVACLKALVNKNNVCAHVIRFPVNPIAPFKFSNYKNINFYEKNQLSDVELLELIEKINPSIVICSGWAEKIYLKVCKKYFGKIPTVLAFDNVWTGSLKQVALSKIAPYFFRNRFSHAWVPGNDHLKFTSKIGFNEKNTLLGLYSCDVDYFHSAYNEFKQKKLNQFPHRIIYVGRYELLKGVIEMWQAFVEWQNESTNEWELWCLGRGKLESKMPKHKQIKNFGFVQPQDLKPFISECGVFILPSRLEHWGVVVHEFAAAGFPLISNNNVAAANFFLKEGYNGYVCESSNKDSIKKVFNSLLNTDDAILNQMSRKSYELSSNITPTKWSQTILDIMK